MQRGRRCIRIRENARHRRMAAYVAVCVCVRSYATADGTATECKQDYNANLKSERCREVCVVSRDRMSDFKH